ncbi:MAG: ABC transporter ATP-binding protein [Acidobacteria bacterium]|nr:MAG: ABC transporter ATP-binding protein [Acidobacteriota bacterium]
MAGTYGGLILYRRLLRQARPYWLHIAGVLLLDLLATPLVLLTPLPLKIAVDTVLGSRPLPRFLDSVVPDYVKHSSFRLLVLVAILQVLIVIAIRLQELCGYMLRTQVGEGLTLSFRAQLFRHVQRLSLSYHDTKGTADSIYRIQYDAPSIQWLVMDGLVALGSAGLMFLAMVYVIARINLPLALIALAVSPFVFVLGHTYDRRMGQTYVRAKELESGAMKVVHEVLGAVRVVKAFGREESEERRFTQRSGESAQAHVRIAAAEGVIVLAVNVTTTVGTALVLFIGIRNVQSGALSLGQLLVVLAYLTQLYRPLETVGGLFAGLQSSFASARRALELLDEVPEVAERPAARPLKHAAGAIEFCNVSFSYNTDGLVLRDISFSIPPKTRVGIVGATGAGKTTIASLLTRFYDPVSGQILLDGIDVRDYKLADLRNQFSIVQQETVLFSTSIGENIAYARPDATQALIVEAARLANAHDFISRLPQGYRTEVGERGMTLSGGERQRIALARAFLKDAPILILDEPTSSVDVATEAAIIEAMERLMRERTTFIIAHRLTTLEHCEIFLSIEDGRLVSVRSDVSSAMRDALLLAAGEVPIQRGKADD